MLSLFYMGTLFVVAIILSVTGTKGVEDGKEFTKKDRWVKSLDSAPLDKIRKELIEYGYPEYKDYGRISCVEKLAEIKSRQGRDCRYF